MSIEESVRRYLLFLAGLFISALGICFIIKGSLGSSPISSLPYVVSLGYPISLGTLTLLLNIILIIGQIMMLKSKFKKKQFLQLPISVVFGFFVDISMVMLHWVNPEIYFMKVFYLIVGCLTLGIGISFEVIANVVMLSGEAFVQAISIKWNKEFGMVKIGFDVSLMVLACIMSLILFERIEGVREGTIVAALLVGFVARFFNKRLQFINFFLRHGRIRMRRIRQ